MYNCAMESSMRNAILGVCGLLLVTTTMSAQQPPAAGRGQATAPPPINWPSPPLPDGPLMIDTGLVRPIKVTITKGLTQPWSMVFVPESGGDFTILVAERGGMLRKIRNGVLDPSPVDGLPADIQAAGLAGLMDIQLHPKFADNQLVYLTYHKRQAGAPTAPPAAPPAGRGGRGPAPPPGVVTLARGRWDGSKLVDVKDIFTAQPTGNASRILFARDGTLIMSVGYGDPPQANQGNPDPDKMPPQDPMNLAGKTLRLKDDGTVPPDNPFVGKAGYRPEIYTLGHRNILGLAMNPETGAIWSVENGPNGGDEVNILTPGSNYGWPLVSLGRTYGGPWQGPFSKEGFRDPIIYWMPAIAVSSITFYTGDRLPKWKGDVFVTGMRYGEIPGTGQLHRILINKNLEELRREPLLVDLRRRYRDVKQGRDGLLYLLTDEADAVMLRIEPAE
jgi:glucose/arabinose dehydrogenase